MATKIPENEQNYHIGQGPFIEIKAQWYDRIIKYFNWNYFEIKDSSHHVHVINKSTLSDCIFKILNSDPGLVPDIQKDYIFKIIEKNISAAQQIDFNQFIRSVIQDCKDTAFKLHQVREQSLSEPPKSCQKEQGKTRGPLSSPLMYVTRHILGLEKSSKSETKLDQSLLSVQAFSDLLLEQNERLERLEQRRWADEELWKVVEQAKKEFEEGFKKKSDEPFHKYIINLCYLKLISLQSKLNVFERESKGKLQGICQARRESIGRLCAPPLQEHPDQKLKFEKATSADIFSLSFEELEKNLAELNDIEDEFFMQKMGQLNDLLDIAEKSECQTCIDQISTIQEQIDRLNAAIQEAETGGGRDLKVFKGRAGQIKQRLDQVKEVAQKALAIKDASLSYLRALEHSPGISFSTVASKQKEYQESVRKYRIETKFGSKENALAESVELIDTLRTFQQGASWWRWYVSGVWLAQTDPLNPHSKKLVTGTALRQDVTGVPEALIAAKDSLLPLISSLSEKAREELINTLKYFQSAYARYPEVSLAAQKCIHEFSTPQAFSPVEHALPQVAGRHLEPIEQRVSASPSEEKAQSSMPSPSVSVPPQQPIHPSTSVSLEALQNEHWPLAEGENLFSLIDEIVKSAPQEAKTPTPLGSLKIIIEQEMEIARANLGTEPTYEQFKKQFAEHLQILLATGWKGGVRRAQLVVSFPSQIRNNLTPLLPLLPVLSEAFAAIPPNNIEKMIRDGYQHYSTRPPAIQ
jgi:hypothetical protein